MQAGGKSGGENGWLRRGIKFYRSPKVTKGRGEGGVGRGTSSSIRSIGDLRKKDFHEKGEWDWHGHSTNEKFCTNVCKGGRQ